MTEMRPFRLRSIADDGILHAQNAFNKGQDMQLQLKQPVIALEAGQVVTLDDAQGTRIVTRMGTVWVTEEGDARDHVIGPGDALVVARPGRTLVQALQASWISLADGHAAANDE
jgi:hypothetical protein